MPNPENIEPHKFKKGQSGNPKGRPKKLISDVITELKESGVKETSLPEIRAVYLMLINETIPALTKRAKNDKEPAMIRIVSKAILSGKGFEIIEKMLDRSIGKAQQFMDITTGGEQVDVRPPIKWNDED